MTSHEINDGSLNEFYNLARKIRNEVLSEDFSEFQTCVQSLNIALQLRLVQYPS
ncbi:MAG: hypothetical protein ACTSW1_16095 [Candidatus Hodarchaeales archaeon]